MRITAILKKLGFADSPPVEQHSEEVLHRLASERVRCPLLNDGNQCSLYAHRPITCRLYGIPTRINGSGYTCGKSGFKKGVVYPTVNLDIIHHKLRLLSQDLMKDIGSHRKDKAAIMTPVSVALRTTYDKVHLPQKPLFFC